MDNVDEIEKHNYLFEQHFDYTGNRQFLKKEIIYDIDKDKYYLCDKENNKQVESNFLGQRISKMNIAQAGKASYLERLKSGTVEKVSNKIDDSLYHPRMKFFDGFTQVPRPLVQPFSNETNIKSKNDLINCIKKQKSVIFMKKIQDLFNKRNDNNIILRLEYYSGTIANANNVKNKKMVVKYIDDFIKQNKDNNYISQKDIKVLKKFRNNILINSANVINGTKLTKPKDSFINQYIVNHNVMFVNQVDKSNKDSLINEDIYNILYKSINNNQLTSIKSKSKRTMPNSKSSKDKEKNKKNYILARPKSVVNIISNNFKLTKKNNSNKDNKNNNILNDTSKKLKKLLFLPSRYEFKKEVIKRYDTNEENNDKESISNNKNNNKLTKSQSANSLDKNNNIRYCFNLKKYYVKEKKYLVGYQKQMKKEKPLIRKGNAKLKTSGELYKQDLDLLKIVNPKKIKIEEEEMNKRMNYLKKNIDKKKTIKIYKYKKLRNQNSRVNSTSSKIAKDNSGI